MSFLSDDEDYEYDNGKEGERRRSRKNRGKEEVTPKEKKPLTYRRKKEILNNPAFFDYLSDESYVYCII